MLYLKRIARKIFQRGRANLPGNCPISFSARSRKKLHRISFLSHHGF